MMTKWNFLTPASSTAQSMSLMHDFVMVTVVSVMIFVSVLMLFTLYYNSFNLEFFENHELEGVWTISPFIILIFLVFPSTSTLYLLDSCDFCGLTLVITGHQWYWTYTYSDLASIYTFDSYMISEASHNIRLADVDNRAVLPSNTPIRFLVTSADVIHSWTLPSLGVKMDAIPGRINQFCVTLDRTGVFFGQCSEICGANHSFMPIVLEVVQVEDYFNLMT